MEHMLVIFLMKILLKIIVNKFYCIVYSLNKYRETEGKKDIGSNFWNQGRTQEIKERVVHVGNGE